MEIGLYSFAENTPDPLNGGHLQSPAERLRDLLEEIKLADEVGLDFYGLGEHHRPDYVASSPVTILAAAAARTKQIRLSTAVTVLSSEEKAFVFDELASPLDIDAVVARADTPEHASEIYAASLVAMKPDTAAERGYLDALAFKLKLPQGLVDEIHRQAGATAPAAPSTTPNTAASYVPNSNV